MPPRRLSSIMRLLLLLSEPAQLVCADYFRSRGCDVDTAVDLDRARCYVRFRAYDGVVIDVTGAGDSEGCRNLVQDARLRNPAVRAALLTTGTAPAWQDAEAAVLTKPLPLAVVYDAVAPVRPAPAVEDRGAASRP